MKNKKFIKKVSVFTLAGVTALVPVTSLYAKTNVKYYTCKPSSMIKPGCGSTMIRPGFMIKPGCGITIIKPGCGITNRPGCGITNRPGCGITNKPENDTTNKPNDDVVTKPEDNTTNKPNDDTVTTPQASTQTSFENRVLELVNEERAKYGLSALKMDESVRAVARVKSTDMYKNNYFNHTSPTYGTPFNMLKTYGITYRSAAENIAQGYTSPEAVVNGWMNSSGHRANILNANYTHIGVGYEANGNYWTQMFIQK